MEAQAKRIDWTNTLFLLGTPVLSLILVILFPWREQFSFSLLLVVLFFYFATGLGITAGYHRLASHRSYQAHPVIKFLLLFFGAGAFENSALKWSTDHRLHHAHVDGEQDPYNIQKGLLYAHIGWIVMKEPELTAKDFPADLARDPIVAFQHRHYLLLAILSGLVLPALAGWLLADSWLGGLALAGFGRIVFVHHATFSINSLCHRFGTAPYSHEHSARDSFWLALFTFGEGYHNFHHCFQTDYRNGIRWYHYDPAKWMIRFLSWVKLTGKLKRADPRLIQQALGAQRGLS